MRCALDASGQARRRAGAPACRSEQVVARCVSEQVEEEEEAVVVVVEGEEARGG